MKLKIDNLTTIAFILMLSVMTSCKKYTCECTAYNLYIIGGNLGAGSSTVRGAKNKCTQECRNKSIQPDNNGDYHTCEIK